MNEIMIPLAKQTGIIESFGLLADRNQQIVALGAGIGENNKQVTSARVMRRTGVWDP